tara:strand:- start:467 stop:1456 length:990 start_codon:yes stop_codon:yes gene_type:complete
MIIKYFNLKSNSLKQNKILLFYGNNEGLKNETISKITNNKKISSYEEKEILENSSVFFDNLFSGSLFEDEKVFLIKRATDRLLQIIEELNERDIQNSSIIINANALEKKSKLRNFFEKHKELVSVAFYPDTPETLSQLAQTFFKKEKIPISNSDINIIVDKSNGDRLFLNNEITKIILYTQNKKKITSQEIKKLINLSENHSITELADSCLNKNIKKTTKILNENNFNNDDCILILRNILNKSKKILLLAEEFEKNNNMDLTISSAKPPIFWKDKENVIKQIYQWKPKNIKILIYKLGELELTIKKNFDNALSLITDFILEQASKRSNN